MKTHYYFGWFNNVFPEKLVRLLHEDITDRKSLVMISANPFLLEDEEVGATERSWLGQANILFDEYHLIDFGVPKDEAQKLIINASVIFLLGGNTIEQNGLLIEYELLNLIKRSRAVVMGTSAGAINMSAKWLCSKYTGYKGEVNSICNGIGLDNFSVLSHFDLENNFAQIQSELSALSEEMNVYVSNKDCAVRVKGEKIDILGNVYLMSHSKIHKLDETLKEEMYRLKLVLPTPEHKDQLMDYKREFIECGDSMDGSAGLKIAVNFEEWYRAFCDNLNEETVRAGLVPATTYMAISKHDGRLVGMIDIRHRLNDYLLKVGGHIGYSVRKSERQQGYANEMLTLALAECVKLGIRKALITCDKTNVASAKTILRNGGKLENEVEERNEITQRYWITLE